MPDAAFRDRAKHAGLLLGRRDGTIVAYLLYDIPRHNLIKLVHLCVGADARGSGIAKSLVEEAISLHPSRSFLTAACRADYGIDGFWQSLGMHAAAAASPASAELSVSEQSRSREAHCFGRQRRDRDGRGRVFGGDAH
ncbi:GNAT family N-acetyltransferase [Microbacterium neungamense]|uniref:GNAT family N-acetyltransferase n=1 Tax=Microbacterium TaxID=33882 RepID=UPI0030922D3F|nr:GNAT family N-acetyltransferase [Microbacterium neungamense]WCM56595.1 GNAT family N-acetyltransferase [Microbacterium sp. EF45047]